MTNPSDHQALSTTAAELLPDDAADFTAEHDAIQHLLDALDGLIQERDAAIGERDHALSIVTEVTSALSTYVQAPYESHFLAKEMRRLIGSRPEDMSDTASAP